MRKFAVVAIVVCVVVVLVLALIPQFLDVNHYRPRIQTELQTRLGRPVTLGEIKASFLPPSLIVKDVVIGEDPHFGAGPFAKAQELNVRVALIPLLRKDLQVKSLRLVNPDIELIKSQGGHWNYASLGQAQKQPSAQPAAAAPPTLDHLEITKGRLRFIDQKENVQNTYDNIDVTARPLCSGEGVRRGWSRSSCGQGRSADTDQGNSRSQIGGNRDDTVRRFGEPAGSIARRFAEGSEYCSTRRL